MSSFKRQRLIAWIGLCGSIILAVYSGALGAGGNATAAYPSVSCTLAEGRPSLHDVALAKSLQRNIETSPLYTIPASTVGFSTCRIHYYPEGLIELEYHFRAGAWLRVRNDETIEYTEQSARFNLTSKEHPEAMLARAERAAFGVDGCGIDWHQSEIQQAEDDGNLADTLFRGDICNCQASIRRNASGHIVRFMLRSAC
jgi:hypothetical protein